MIERDYVKIIDELRNERDFYKQSYINNLKITFNINVSKSNLLYTSFENTVVDKIISECIKYKADFLEVSPKLYNIIAKSTLGKIYHLKMLDELKIDGVTLSVRGYYNITLVKNNWLGDRYFLLARYLKSIPNCLGYLKGKVRIPKNM